MSLAGEAIDVQNFAAFVAGEIVLSPEPERVGGLSRPAMRRLGETRPLPLPYGAHTIEHESTEGHLVKSPRFPKDKSVEIAHQEFCAAVGSFDSEHVGVSWGRFGLLRQLFDRTGVTDLHIDGIEDDEQGLVPVNTTFCAVGATSLVFCGDIRRRYMNGSDTTAVPVKGKWVRLEEGGIYRLTPVTGHCQPRAPIMPASRFFWRHMQPSS